MIENNDNPQQPPEPRKIDPDAIFAVQVFSDGRGRKITMLFQYRDPNDPADWGEKPETHFVAQATVTETHKITKAKRQVVLQFEIHGVDNPRQAFALFDAAAEQARVEYVNQGKRQIVRPGLVFPQ